MPTCRRPIAASRHVITCAALLVLACQPGAVSDGLGPSTPPADSVPTIPGGGAPSDTTVPDPPHLPTVPDTTPPPPGRILSPHWDHIRMSHTDFHYNLTDPERDWMAAHYDMIMGGDVAEWKGRNPGLLQTSYDLLATMEAGGARFDRMRQWFASTVRNPDGLELEAAFLHEVNGAGSAAARRQFQAGGTTRWVMNPADPGYREYVRWLVASRVALGFDGVFFDEFDSGSLKRGFPAVELADEAAYSAAFAGLFAGVHELVPQPRVVINSATYAKALDQKMLDAAGAGHLEGMNNPLHGSWVERWAWAEAQIARGHLVEWVGGKTTADALPATFSSGNAPTPMARLKLTELAGYYLLRPSDPSRFFLDLRIAWNQIPSEQWLRAAERDVGQPVGGRHKLMSGTDGLGRKFDIWARAYERALVIVRPQIGWDAQDYQGGSVNVQLPPGPWRLLRVDGGLGPWLEWIGLRVAEGVILIREGT